MHRPAGPAFALNRGEKEHRDEAIADGDDQDDETSEDPEMRVGVEAAEGVEWIDPGPAFGGRKGVREEKGSVPTIDNRHAPSVDPRFFPGFSFPAFCCVINSDPRCERIPRLLLTIPPPIRFYLLRNPKNTLP